MSVLICGSLAFDTIAAFPGRFAEQVRLPNVALQVPALFREYGGSAGNIAYTLVALGDTPQVVASVGSDGLEYVARLAAWGLSTERIRVIDNRGTAQALVITDLDHNQITAFCAGAMEAAPQALGCATGEIRLAIVAPSTRQAMLEHVAQLSELDIPFVFDPGQSLPMFDVRALRHCVGRARWVTLNEHEARTLCEQLGGDLAALSRSHLHGVIVTLGANGCELWLQGERVHVPGEVARRVVDPTGCGDAFRGALLYGLDRSWPLARCAHLAVRIGALAVEQRGGQNHVPDRTLLDL